VSAERTPADERAVQLHCARVYLREARSRRGTAFSTTLLQWAANARRRSLAIDLRPAQRELAL
jgi:hypothetical protein